MAAESFVSTGHGEWTSPPKAAPFPFDELIYSWNVHLPPTEGFRIYLKVAFAPGDESPWLYAGFWGSPKDLVTSRTTPKFDRGELDMDWLKLKQKATSYQFRVVDESTTPLSVRPSLSVVTTDNSPSPELAARFAPTSASLAAAPPILDLPFRRQQESNGKMAPNRCQSAALATAMQYYGTSVPLEQIVDRAYDVEYDYPGIWPRVIGAADAFGFDGYIDRFRDWDAVRRAVAENKVVLCSIRLKKGEAQEPPYDSMGNHIVALNGITDDGRVVVTDSFLAKSGRGYRCQWKREDFEQIWMKNKNGVGLVICPPQGARRRSFTGLPPFPASREPIIGDDH